ncbi:DUF4259 domain-containing protein [Saccharopolyspora cebuensis]|uniref:DUF4259 domain-containing protein n=1 Tax=Saccharopolyspora cebuensis TaxID=418759 RepID=A0ABV4CMS8_9PSEU
MSASGTGPLDNDSALDLCDDLRELAPEQAVDALRAALRSAADVPPGDYLERDTAEAAIAAAALVLARRGGAAVVLADADLTLPEPPADLVGLIPPALSRALAPDSEVRGLWADAGLGDSWRAEVERLRREATGS